MLFVQGGILTGKLSDEALIQMYRDGSRDSIDELFERYKAQSSAAELSAY